MTEGSSRGPARAGAATGRDAPGTMPDSTGREGGSADAIVMAALAAAFFASGFAALLYQTIWQRMLGMFAGSDAVTAAIVVGAFLLGLGLGSLAASLFVDRLGMRKAALGFAACEVVVAGFALLSRPFLYDLVVERLGPLLTSRWEVFGVCFLGLLAPTLMMGLSLPLLSKAVVARIESAASRIGLLYGINTAAAGLGALVGGWYIIGTIGFESALWLGALLNLLAGVLAVLILPLLPRAEPAASAPAAAAAAQAHDARPAPARAEAAGFGLGTWTVLVFASGFFIVALEILWVRILGMTAQANAYVFSLILGVFLLADGLGVVAGSRWVKRLDDTRGPFFLVQGWAAVYALLSLVALWLAYDWAPFAAVLGVDQPRMHFPALWWVILLVVLIVAPPAYLLGLSFPLVQKAVPRDLSSIGYRVGLVQLGNIIGNAAGSLFAGLVSLHWLGSAGTARLVGALALVLLLFWLWQAVMRERAPALRHAQALVAAAVLALAVFAFPSNRAFWFGVHAVKPHQTGILAEDRSGVTLMRIENGRGPMFIAGFAQSRVPPWPIHYLLGALGPAIHPKPEEVMLIGVAAAGTPYAAGLHPATRHVHAVELVAPVYTALRDYAAQHPESLVGRMLADPRYRLSIGDGRHEVFVSGRRYDVIEADAILPNASHSGMLYSVEFLRLVRAALKPGGIYVQWAPTARVAESFMSVFPHGVLVRPASILVGSDRPVPFDAAAVLARLTSPEGRAYAAPAAVDLPAYAREIAGPHLVWAPDTPRPTGDVNTDLWPRDEYYLNNPVRGAHEVRLP